MAGRFGDAVLSYLTSRCRRLASACMCGYCGWICARDVELCTKPQTGIQTLSRERESRVRSRALPRGTSLHLSVLRPYAYDNRKRSIMSYMCRATEMRFEDFHVVAPRRSCLSALPPKRDSKRWISASIASLSSLSSASASAPVARACRLSSSSKYQRVTASRSACDGSTYDWHSQRGRHRESRARREQLVR